MSRNRTITCRKCKQKFTRLEYQNNTDCDRMDCTCPSIVKARRMTEQIIADAQEGSRTRISVEWSPVESNRDPKTKQVYVECPEVMTILVTPVKGRKQ